MPGYSRPSGGAERRVFLGLIFHFVFNQFHAAGYTRTRNEGMKEGSKEGMKSETR